MRLLIRLLMVITGILLAISIYRGLTTDTTKADYLLVTGYSSLILLIVALQKKI